MLAWVDYEGSHEEQKGNSHINLVQGRARIRRSNCQWHPFHIMWKDREKSHYLMKESVYFPRKSLNEVCFLFHLYSMADSNSIQSSTSCKTCEIYD